MDTAPAVCSFLIEQCDTSAHASPFKKIRIDGNWCCARLGLGNRSVHMIVCSIAEPCSGSAEFDPPESTWDGRGAGTGQRQLSKLGHLVPVDLTLQLPVDLPLHQLVM